MNRIIFFVRNLSKPKRFLWSVTPDNSCTSCHCRSSTHVSSRTELETAWEVFKLQYCDVLVAIIFWVVVQPFCPILQFVWSLKFETYSLRLDFLSQFWKDESGTLFSANWSHSTKINEKEETYGKNTVTIIVLYPPFACSHPSFLFFKNILGWSRRLHASTRCWCDGDSHKTCLQ